MVQRTIDAKRKLADGAKAAEDDLARLSESDQRWDLCAVAQIYGRHEQYDAERRLLDACFKLGTHPRREFLPVMAQIAWSSGDWKGLHKLLAEWQSSDAAAVAKWQKSYESGMPADE